MKRSVDVRSNGYPGVRYAAIYARISTEDQGKGASIPTQLEACRKLAGKHSYVVRDAYVCIDDGISGATLKRQA